MPSKLKESILNKSPFSASKKRCSVHYSNNKEAFESDDDSMGSLAGSFTKNVNVKSEQAIQTLVMNLDNPFKTLADSFYHYYPHRIPRMVSQTSENGVTKIWTIDVLRVYFLHCDPNDLMNNSFCLWIGSSAGPYVANSERCDAIYLECPPVPGNFKEDLGDLLYPKENREEMTEIGNMNFSCEATAAMEAEQKQSLVMGTKRIVKLIAKDDKGNNLCFTNHVFNDSQSEGKLKLRYKVVSHPVFNVETKLKVGKHKNPFRYCVVGIIRTEKNLSSTDDSTEDDAADIAAAYGAY